MFQVPTTRQSAASAGAAARQPNASTRANLNIAPPSARQFRLGSTNGRVKSCPTALRLLMRLSSRVALVNGDRLHSDGEVVTARLPRSIDEVRYLALRG